MIIVLSLFIALSSPQRGTPPPASPDALLAEIRARVDAYERRPKTAGEDRGELAQIARLGMTNAQEARGFDVWSEACASAFSEKASGCERRLRAMAERPDAPVEQRAAAAAILVRGGKAGAPELLTGIVKGLDPKGLASVAPHLAVLPEAAAVPLLVRAMTSASSTDRAAACKALGTIDGGTSRRALAEAVASMPSGSPEWLACSVSRARLNEPDATWKLQGISGYMSGEALLDAADAMVAIGNTEGALYAVQKAMRQGAGPEQISAGRRLAKLDPAAAASFVDARLKGADPRTRAQLLEIEPFLRRSPSALVRGAMADPDDLVRLRAAEAVLRWAAADGR